MFIVLLVIHVIACMVLIAVILLQAGRGGGLSEAFGGSETQSLLGTQAPVILKKATTISAIAFLITSLLLGMLTARRGRSLFQQMRSPVMPTPVSQPVEGQTVPVSQPGQGQPATDTQ